MADYIFESRVWLAKPRAEVFAFFADPAHLLLVTPPRLALTLEGTAREMGAGDVLDYRLVWLGVPLRWRAFIREYDPPFRFVDVQVRGPYARWEHRHRFLEDGGGTWVEDRVTYRPPLGVLGRVAHALVIGREVERLWRYRNRRLGELVAPVKAAPD